MGTVELKSANYPSFSIYPIFFSFCSRHDTYKIIPINPFHFCSHYFFSANLQGIYTGCERSGFKATPDHRVGLHGIAVLQFLLISDSHQGDGGGVDYENNVLGLSMITISYINGVVEKEVRDDTSPYLLCM